jgi:hypothetical protein
VCVLIHKLYTCIHYINRRTHKHTQARTHIRMLLKTVGGRSRLAARMHSVQTRKASGRGHIYDIFMSTDPPTPVRMHPKHLHAYPNTHVPVCVEDICMLNRILACGLQTRRTSRRRPRLPLRRPGHRRPRPPPAVGRTPSQSPSAAPACRRRRHSRRRRRQSAALPGARCAV